MKSYKELIVWQKATDPVKEIYRITKLLPKEETCALADQMKRAAISVPSNIAEGNGRFSTKEYIHHLGIARGSLYEVETQLFLCAKLEYVSEEAVQKADSLCKEIGKLINTIAGRLGENTRLPGSSGKIFFRRKKHLP